jgi:endonuclease/exonuclease/phosphatase family metal-dependent hydrolase
MSDKGFRLVTWNLNCSFRKRDDKPWAFIASLEPDVALVQESYRPLIEGAVGSEIGGTRSWGSWVVPFGGASLTAIPTVPVSNDAIEPAGALEMSHPGAFAVADVQLPSDRAVTVASVYGMLAFSVLNRVRYAVTTLHRTLSDLTPILDVHRTPRPVVLAGDLNVSPQITWPDTAAHVAVIDRIKAFGLSDCLGDMHDGQYVRTFGKVETPFQDDWVFASPSLTCTRCEPVDTDEAWALSDHCPVMAEFEFAS